MEEREGKGMIKDLLDSKFSMLKKTLKKKNKCILSSDLVQNGQRVVSVEQA